MRPAEWSVTVNGCGQQGWETFPEAVEHVADAARSGRSWDARVRGPRDSAFRVLKESEVATLIAAVTKEMTR